MEFLRKLVEIIIRKHRQLKRLYRAVFVLSCIVVFVTSYALTLPAITLDRETAEASAGIGGFEVQGQAAPESGESDEGTDEDRDGAEAQSQEENDADPGSGTESNTETDARSDPGSGQDTDAGYDREEAAGTESAAAEGTDRDSAQAQEPGGAANAGTAGTQTAPVQEPEGALRVLLRRTLHRWTGTTAAWSAINRRQQTGNFLKRPRKPQIFTLTM